MREVIVETGEYMRVSIFPTRRTASRVRGRRRAPTKEAQARLNAINSANRLADLVQLNFSPDDILVDLTYDDENMPESAEEAQRVARNYQRRLRARWAKVTGRPASEYKYIYITEIASTGRVHHHCIISGGLSRDEVEAVWRAGRARTRRPQFDERGMRGWSYYVTKARTPATYKRWCASKNLVRPEPRKNDYRISMLTAKRIMSRPYDEIISLYPGWKLADVEIAEEVGVFITLYLYREDNAYFRRLRGGLIDYTYRPRRAV